MQLAAVTMECYTFPARALVGLPLSNRVFKPAAEEGHRLHRAALGGGGLTRRYSALEATGFSSH